MFRTPYIYIILFLLFGISVPAQTYHSVLENGAWYKIAVTESGVYKLTGADLQAAGADLTGCDVSTIRMMGRENVALPELCSAMRPDDLTEMAVTVADNNGNGIFDADDYILFYATGNLFWHNNSISGNPLKLLCDRNPYSDTTFCYLNCGLTQGKRIENLMTPDDIETNDAITEFTGVFYYEKELFNVHSSGRVWYGESFTDSLVFPVTLDGLVSGKPVLMQLDLMGRSSDVFKVDAYDRDNALFKNAIIKAYTSVNYGYELNKNVSWIPESPDLNLNIKINATSSATLFLDKVLINYPRFLGYSGNQMPFDFIEMLLPSQTARLDNITDGLVLWDVTYPLEPVNVSYYKQEGSAFFGVGDENLNSFVAFEVSNAKKPVAVKRIANQNLHSVAYADMIVLVPSKYYSYAEEIAEFHRTNDAMEVVVARVEDVYNEFSAGNADLTALRDFIRMVYKRNNAALKYVLLFGKASYDVRNNLRRSIDFVPTYETVEYPCNEVSSFCSDDYFGMLDDDDGPECMGKLDIAVGRIPVNSVDDAAIAIRKIKAYNNSAATYGSWRGRILFVADVGDTYHNNSETCSNLLESVSSDVELQKTFFGAFPVVKVSSGELMPAATADLTKRLDDGALVMFYSGHGGVTGLSKRSVFTTSDISAMRNGSMLPFVYTATCEFSKFDNPELVSAGEQMMFHDNGGAIAMLTTTRPTYATNTVKVSKALAQLLGSLDEDGNAYRFGDLVRLAKANPQLFSYVNRGMVLFGDPALRIALPSQRIVTEDLHEEFDVLVPGQEIDMLCHITDANGNVDTLFNGIAEIGFFAGKTRYVTLLDNPKNFSFHNDVVYKGTAVVTNGYFNIRFVLPANVDYGKYIAPRASLYAYDSIRGVDALGAWLGMSIDSGQSSVTDIEGPKIEMLWNGVTLNDGDTIGFNGNLCIRLDDESGVYHYDYLIGRDITLNTSLAQMSVMMLNNDFVSQPDDFRGGNVTVLMEDMPVGKHTFTVKAWDLCDNTSTKTLELNVIDNTLYHVANYPNPFSDKTNFVFSTSLFEDVKVLIEIYNIVGQKVKHIEREANQGASIEWNGTDFAGVKLGAGVYPYRVTISDGKGMRRSVMQKLIITQ